MRGCFVIVLLLIAPEGIEIISFLTFSPDARQLLIAPEGIEICVSFRTCLGYYLLIAPEGIEIE